MAYRLPREWFPDITVQAKNQILACSPPLRTPMIKLAEYPRSDGSDNNFTVHDKDVSDRDHLSTVLSYASCGFPWEDDSTPIDFRTMWVNEPEEYGGQFFVIRDLNRLCRGLYAANMQWLHKNPVRLNADDKSDISLFGGSDMWKEAYAKYNHFQDVWAFRYDCVCPPVARIVSTRTPYKPDGSHVLSLRVFAKAGISWVHLIRELPCDAQEGQLVFLEDYLSSIDPTPIFFTHTSRDEADAYQLDRGEL